MCTCISADSLAWRYKIYIDQSHSDKTLLPWLQLSGEELGLTALGLGDANLLDITFLSRGMPTSTGNVVGTCNATGCEQVCGRIDMLCNRLI